MSFLKEIRCSCHRLLMKVSSTSCAKIEAKCPRCSLISTHNICSTG